MQDPEFKPKNCVPSPKKVSWETWRGIISNTPKYSRITMSDNNYFTVTSREDFESSQHNEMRNV
jgi:hypothetical protein